MSMWRLSPLAKWLLGTVLLILPFLTIAHRREGQLQALPSLPKDADFSRGWTGERKVALTFDFDQAPPREEILDILQARGVKATFFLTGRSIEIHPDFVLRIVRDGHEVGNHTYSHPHLTSFGVDGRQKTLATVTKQGLQDELRVTVGLFEQLTGRSMPPLWRAPYGEHNQEIRSWAAELGYQHIGWTENPETAENLDSLDWVSDRSSWLYFTAAQIRNRILNFGDATPEGLSGGIVIFHLGTDRTEDHVDHELPAIIDGIQERGYQLGPVSELRWMRPPASVPVAAGHRITGP
jgi:peptidoglycan-N-acetylglucosamine deacetylase